MFTGEQSTFQINQEFGTIRMIHIKAHELIVFNNNLSSKTIRATNHIQFKIIKISQLSQFLIFLGLGAVRIGDDKHISETIGLFATNIPQGS